MLRLLRAIVSLRLGFFVLSLSFGFLALSGCGRATDPMESAALGTGELRWGRFPVSVKMDETLLDGGAAEEDLLAAVSFWENKAGRPLLTLGAWPSGTAPFSGPAHDPESLLDNVIFFQNPWPGPWGNRVAGKTIIHARGSAIQNAVIFLNAETHLCSALCEWDTDRTSRRKLLAHELGHFLGFAHVNERNNLMYPEILPGGSLDSLQIDESLLQKLTASP